MRGSKQNININFPNKDVRTERASFFNIYLIIASLNGQRSFLECHYLGRRQTNTNYSTDFLK